jgi:hypothetical protein
MQNGTRRPPYCRKRFRERKTCKLDPTSSVPPKMNPGADALRTAENESGRPGAQNVKKGPGALDTVENVSGRAKHEDGT